MNREQFFLDLWAEREDGQVFYPYKGVKGDKKGLYSVNFTNDTNNFSGLSEEELIGAVLTGRFAARGTIRMLPRDAVPGADRNAFAPTHYKGKPVPKLGEEVHSLHSKPRSIFPDEVSETPVFTEGAIRQVLVNAYERSAAAREACIAHHGTACKVCSIDFSTIYGEIGVGFIHVHHIRKIADLGSVYAVDPVRDLVPVCPNCHAMLHRTDPPLGVQELRMKCETHNSSVMRLPGIPRKPLVTG